MSESINFKIGKLSNLNNQVCEITNENNQVVFFLEGVDNNSNTYSINFCSIISQEEMLKFQLNEHIDFIKYVDAGDIVIGINGKFDLNAEIKMDIMRYLSNSFLLNISFQNREDLIGKIELDFKLKK